MPEQKVKCPNCDGEAVLSQTVDNVEHFGSMMFSVLKCGYCGFRLSDVMSLAFQSPSSFEAKVSKASDLSIKIIKSSTGTVKIPELGVEIEPGPASEGYFTNLEGLLDRVEQVSRILLNSATKPVEVKAAEKALHKVLKAREGKFKFKVKVLDPFGNSALIGNGVKKRALSEKEAARLKKPLMIVQGG